MMEKQNKSQWISIFWDSGVLGPSSPFLLCIPPSLKDLHIGGTSFPCPWKLFITFSDIQMWVKSSHQTEKQPAKRLSNEPLT